ncbi:MAG TPA: hypothetical protein VIY68_11745 [Steroidobacteraceae bacterium]
MMLAALSGRYKSIRVICALCATTLLSLFALRLSADTPNPEQTNAPSKRANPPLDTITVEAQRSRKELEKRVDQFLSSVIVRQRDRPFARWRQPVCPIILGLLKDQGDFMVGRLSEIARQAGVPLAPAKCTVNFAVIATQEPHELINILRRRRPGLFDTRQGESPFKRYRDVSRPVRVWYNAEFTASDGTPFWADTVNEDGSIKRIYTKPRHYGGHGTTYYGDVREITTAIILLDTNMLHDNTVGQLADYIAVVGLAEINLDGNLGDAPTILHLFRAGGQSFDGHLSVWDQAFLKSLYDTPQESMFQLSKMTTEVVEIIAP